jgi:thiamine-phosphate pyrophosphorylase
MPAEAMRTPRGLYAITPESLSGEALLDRVARALEGGLGALQYRDKSGDRARRLRDASALARLCRDAGTLFIVNDDIDLALEVDAGGAHLGGSDGDLAAARTRLGPKCLGASCYDSLALAGRAVAAGADYIAFGSVYASPTKPAAVRAPLALFATALPLGVPMAAIGGITLDNAPAVIEAGADSLAVITDLFDAPDIALRARRYGALFAAAGSK